jgi:hypothetical protein
MTLDEAVAVAGQKIDAIIEKELGALEARIRADLAATGPENDDELDIVPNPDSPWRRITVEEILMRERAKLATWRASFLMTLRDHLAQVGAL